MPGIRAGLVVSAVVAVGLTVGAFVKANDENSTAQGLAAWDQVYSVLISPALHQLSHRH